MISIPVCTESSILQLKLKALILDIIHNISMVKQLNQAGVTSTDDWAWRKQLRFYMGADKFCHIHMVDAQFSYTYEYQVHTLFHGFTLATVLLHAPTLKVCLMLLGLHLRSRFDENGAYFCGIFLSIFIFKSLFCSILIHPLPDK